MSRLLIVANTPSANTAALARAAARGARHPDIDGVAVDLKTPAQAGAEDVLAASAIILGTTENFGYMSGQMKDFFERVYYACLERTEAKPWALYIRAGRDGTGTNRAVHAIVGGMRWREVQPPLLLVGAYQPKFVADCETLGATIAASLSAGLY